MNDVFVDPHPLGAFACGIFQRCWFEGGVISFNERQSPIERTREKERHTRRQTFVRFGTPRLPQLMEREARVLARAWLDWFPCCHMPFFGEKIQYIGIMII